MDALARDWQLWAAVQALPVAIIEDNSAWREGQMGCIVASVTEPSFGLYASSTLDGCDLADLVRWMQERAYAYLTVGPEVDGWERQHAGDWQLWATKRLLPAI